MQIKKALRYATLSGLIALIDITLFYFFAEKLHYNYLAVNFVGFFMGTALNYIACLKLVFKDSSGTKRKLLSVYLASSAGIALLTALLYLFHSVLGIDLVKSKIFSVAITFIYNYSIRSLVLFRPPSPQL
jgi:putative flippase GtrA